MNLESYQYLTVTITTIMNFIARGQKDGLLK